MTLLGSKHVGGNRISSVIVLYTFLLLVQVLVFILVFCHKQCTDMNGIEIVPVEM
jgi:hypothetical protein